MFTKNGHLLMKIVLAIPQIKKNINVGFIL